MTACKKRILVVDDDDGIRTSLARILCASGYDVQVAKDGFEALDIAAESSFDLLLVDLRMPGIDGVKTLRRLRDSIPSLSAIVMTADAGAEVNTLQAESGAMLIQSKPLDVAALLTEIERICGANPILEK